MTFDELIDIVDGAYPEGLVRKYVDDPDGYHGDGLAKFIAVELKETFDPAESSSRQLDDAVRAIARSVNDLNEVLDELRNTLVNGQ